MTIDPNKIKERKAIDKKVAEVEPFFPLVEKEDNVAVIHMKYAIANLYYSLLKEIFPHTVAMYEDEIIATVGLNGMHYMYLTGKIDYCGQPDGHRLFLI